MDDRQLAATFREAIKMWDAMRADGASIASCVKALENSLRAAWPQPPERDWPHWARVPRCLHCHGYGLIMRTVTNRLGCVVEEGTPCTCQEGRRYSPRPVAETDFTAAGKVAQSKSKGFSRWNG